MSSQKLALFGGGSACLFAAVKLSEKHEVHLYEQGKTIGRKFLVAGKGGFNLTNQAVGAALLMNYKAADNIEFLHQSIQTFDSKSTRDWLAELGIETFVGSSGRVFPKQGIKPAEVLQRIKEKLTQNGVKIHLNHAFVDFDAQFRPMVQNADSIETIEADHYFFGLGGGSWKKTGSNNRWFDAFKKIGVETHPYQSSNCGVCLNWSDVFKNAHAGTPLKNIGIRTKEGYTKGEAVITDYGLEGNAIYPISAEIRNEIAERGSAEIQIDFKPNNTLDDLTKKATKGAVRSKKYGDVFNLNKADIGLLKEVLSKEVYVNPKRVAENLKGLTLVVKDLRGIDEAISTIGGIAMHQIDSNFALKKQPHISLMGEMLDWDAPTGGFLLQGCFSTANQAILPWLV